MAFKRESALQRIQVGVVGLVAVLLFVSLANMLIDSAIMSDVGDERGLSETIFEQKAPDEPLAELGVAPVVEPEEGASRSQESNQGKSGVRVPSNDPAATR